MTDLQRAIRIGELLCEAKDICDSGRMAEMDARLNEIAGECNALHAEMSPESLAALEHGDFTEDMPLYTLKGAAL